MRLPAAAAAAVLAAGLMTTAVAADASTASSPSNAAAPATIRSVVRPVTPAGHVRAGFTVTGEPTGLVDCSFPDPSPGAVNRNILFCSPSAEYAIACWKAAAPNHVLCMRNPRVKKLVRIPDTGSVAHTNPPRASRRAPLAMSLRNGDHCSIRDGGAWGMLRSHPNWVGTYSCDHFVVWAPPSALHQGVNESSASWTVRTAPASGVGPIVIRHVTRAWFVGNFFG